jgi:hypothetical protein
MLERAKRASHIDPPASSYAIMRRASPYRGENPGPGKGVEGELEPRPGIRDMTALPPKAEVHPRSRYVAKVPNADIAGITRLPRWARYSSDGSMAPCRINNGIPSDGDAEGANEGRGGPERHCCEMQCQQRCAKSRKAGNGVR